MIFNVEGVRTPTTLLKISDDNQNGAAGAALTTLFVIEVQDDNDLALEEIPVTFTVTEGGGTLSTQSTTTDANGRAESTLTLGQQPGQNTVTVTVVELEPVTFTAIGEAIPQTLTKSSGDEQRGLAGVQLVAPFVVEVRDQNDSAFAGGGCHLCSHRRRWHTEHNKGHNRCQRQGREYAHARAKSGNEHRLRVCHWN